MEPERPNIDLAVLEFIKGPVFDPADFWNSQRPRLSLNPEMVRMVGAKVSA
jgi:hypothetical protein